MIAIQKIIDFLQVEQISFEKEVDLKTKTWIKRGGIAKLWIQPIKLIEFEKLVIWCQLNILQFEVIGNTSNCYFLNDYNPEIVISTLKLNEIEIKKDTITCDCGYNISRLAKYCILHGIADYEGFIGLPGTVGGAAINNAGCYGSLISDVISDVCIIQNGKKHLLTTEQLSYQHRNSALKSKKIEGVVTSVTFNIEHKENQTILKNRAEGFQLHRKKHQEHTYPNLGSIFSVLEFKTPPIIIRIVNAIIQRLIKYIIRNHVTKQKLRTKLFLLFSRAGKFRKYISEYAIGCFIWKDDNADLAFIEYVDFIKLKSCNYKLEIDIKKRDIE